MAAAPIDFADVLSEELNRLPHAFEPNELAYLALTSKIELPIRDRLAFALYRRLDHLLVAREWKRIDLAVLADDGNTPEMLLEAKALYTFDLVGDEAWVNRYPEKVLADLDALWERSDLGPRTQLFALVLAAHPTSQPGPRLREVAKYSRGVAKAQKTHGDASAILQQADQALRASLRSVGEIQAGEMDAGTAYNVPVRVPYWLIAASRSRV